MKYKYASIDTETLGLDPETCDVLEVGIVLEDFKSPVESLPSLHFYVTYPDDNYKGNAYAMAMNSEIIGIIANRHNHPSRLISKDETFVPVDMVDRYMHEWLASFASEPDQISLSGKILAAGKNFSGFDLPFLKSIGVGNKDSKTRFHHRCLDPATLFFDPEIDDVPPSLEECLRRSGIDKEVTHHALSDAIDVINVLRYSFAQQAPFVANC
jgi:DNA polymerase III epsilon subunit-like protein